MKRVNHLIMVFCKIAICILVLFVFFMAPHKRQVVCIPAGKGVRTGSEGRRRGARDPCMPCNPRNGLPAPLQNKVGYDVRTSATRREHRDATRRGRSCSYNNIYSTPAEAIAHTAMFHVLHQQSIRHLFQLKASAPSTGRKDMFFEPTYYAL